jgi:hypothetical protein
MSSLDDELDELVQTNLQEKLALEHTDNDDLIFIMAERIRELLAGDLEALMSMMYRLDIDEAKIKFAFSKDSVEDPAVSLAKIIIERQQRRMDTKRKYQQPPLSDFIDFA